MDIALKHPIPRPVTTFMLTSLPTNLLIRITIYVGTIAVF